MSKYKINSIILGAAVYFFISFLFNVFTGKDLVTIIINFFKGIIN